MTADYLNDMRRARSRPAVLTIRWIGFRQVVRARRILVVEGKDDKIVYDYWIRRCHANEEYEFFVADGKNNVLKLAEDVRKGRDEADVKFIVDADFDDNTDLDSDPAIYVLPGYSIENFLVSGEILSGCLRAAFSFDGQQEFRDAICRQFESDYDKFLEVSRGWNRAIFFARRLKVNIDDEIPNSLDIIAEVKVGLIQAGKGLETVILDKCPLDEENERYLDELFAQLEPRFCFRGKFALKFFRVWLDCLLRGVREGNSSVIEIPAGCTAAFDQSELSLGALASRSAIPEDFAHFLPHP